MFDGRPPRAAVGAGAPRAGESPVERVDGGGRGALPARLAGEQSPAGERTARVLAGYRRTAVGRGRGQARPFVASDLAAVLATCHRPRRRGRGVESADVSLKRGRLDAVIAGLLFMAGLRRREVSALRWGDVAAAAAGAGVLVTVRRGKTNPKGEARDVRFVKADVAVAVRTLRAAASPGPEDRVVPLSPQMVGLRFQAAARAAGVEPVTAHSGRVGLASELTRRGASTTDVMLAGNWEDEPNGGALLVRGDGRARGGGAVSLKPSPSVHRVAVVSVGIVGEGLDDADVEGEGGERGRANRIAEGGGGRPGPHRVGVVLVGHLVEDGDDQVLGWRGDAAADALGDERAGCLHAGPELGVVELFGVGSAGG